jgi:2-keto-4-pentenoate hydratase
MNRLLLKLMLLSILLNPLSQTLASQGCTLDGFPGHYIEVYRSQGMVDDCYYQLIGDMDQARILQAGVITLLEDGSRRAGYKVGLTDSKAQEMFGIHQPLVGVLFEEMILPDGVAVDLDSTTSLLVELDLLARVKSVEINEAESVEEVARHIDAIIPFIELPDAMFRLDGGNAAALLMAGNVGARWGVTGTRVTVVDAQDLVERLPSMTFRLTTDTGEVLREGLGERILGHPLNSILHLLKELRLRNETLKQGDLISLGAIGGPVKAEQGRRYTAEYSGYGEKIFTVSVSIR